jgi:hypothetical protein
MMWGTGGSLAELARWVRQDGTVLSEIGFHLSMHHTTNRNHDVCTVASRIGFRFLHFGFFSLHGL